MLGAGALPAELRARILEHAEGNPFYVEEILRSLMASGEIVYEQDTCRWQAARELTDLAIPDTLRGVLASRIDGLDPGARYALQRAAVIGRTFTYRVLSDVVAETPFAGGKGLGSEALDAHLVALQRAQLIRERARLPEVEYIFKHHLTQEAAYDGLLKRERRLCHRQVAEALERASPERIEERPACWPTTGSKRARPSGRCTICGGPERTRLGAMPTPKRRVISVTPWS
jgi:predicted ATPase